MDKNNSAYCDIDGILFNKSKTELIQYPQGNTRRSYIIPDSVTRIGTLAFEKCISLSSITIPDSVTSIGDGVFLDCISLKNIRVDKNNSAYCDVDGVLFDKDKTELIQYPIGKNETSYKTSDSVTSIGYGAFEGCTSLINITIPDSVTSIGDWAFYDCKSLTSVSIPDSVTSIGDWAFSFCTALTSVTIGNSVTSIGGYVFKGCEFLIIKCNPGSFTEEYAIENNIPYEIID